jgi:hypothetical protein
MLDSIGLVMMGVEALVMKGSRRFDGSTHINQGGRIKYCDGREREKAPTGLMSRV